MMNETDRNRGGCTYLGRVAFLSGVHVCTLIMPANELAYLHVFYWHIQ